MKFLFFLSLISLLILSCDNQKHFDRQRSFKSLDFSYNDVFSTCFSIKFTQSDTVFIKQHFASIFSDTSKSNTTYFSLLSNSDRTKLDSFLKKIDLPHFDTLYYQPYQDGIDYQFYFANDTIKKNIRVHSDSVPLPLESFRIWIVTIKKKLLLHQIDTTIDFGSIKDFLPPIAPDPLKKFMTPKIE